MTIEEKIIEYNKNPKFCEECNKFIPYDGNISLLKQYKKRFCDKTCRNIFIAHNRKINNNSYTKNINKPKQNKIIGIYCIENKKNGKKYIGQSTDIKDRLSHHMSNIKYNHSLVRNIRDEMKITKHTVDDFKFYILEECNVSELDDKEKYYVQLYKTYNSKFGYNEDLGGRFTPIYSKRHAERLSKTKKSQFNNKDSDFYKRFLTSQEKTKKPILQVSKDGKIIKKWEFGVLEASDYFNIPSTRIYNAIKNHNKTNGYYWFKEEDIDNIDLSKLKNKSSKESIYQYSFDGFLLNKWDSAYKIQQELGFCSGGIGSACKGKSMQYKGYIWSYVELTKDEVIKMVSKIPKYIIARNTLDKKVV